MTTDASNSALPMRVVYKYELWPWQNTYNVGANPIVRHVDEQNGKAFMWVEQDVSGVATVDILVVGTGVAFDGFGRFVGTVMLRDEGLVLHVYELACTSGEEQTDG